jgi:hypothetical protein
MSVDLFNYKLPTRLYRRLFMLTNVSDYGVRVEPGSLLLRCYTGGESSPLFWCGTPDTLKSFYEVLGHERSIYCIYDTYGVVTPSEENIRALAKYYAAEIMKVQPKGPYILGGYCNSALITYEIANIMVEQGGEVGMLFFLDRDVTESDPWLRIARWLFLRGERLVFRWEQICNNPMQLLKDIFVHKSNQFVDLSILYVKGELGLVQLVKPTDVETYKLTPYPGKIHLTVVKFGLLGYFQFSFFQRYWRKLALGGIDFCFIPGTVHHRPNWLMVAQILHTLLKELGI